MTLPEIFRVRIITLSDRAYRGEYKDLSGPRIREILEEFFSVERWESEIENILVPDDAATLRDLVLSSGENCNLIFTTGGTGIGPNDITVETVKPLLSREIPGIMDFIRIKYGIDKPNALLSRSIAGITGQAIIYTLPGSLKAVNEYMTEICKTLWHTVMMQYGIDTHGKN